jgi:hypothetical protein
MNNNNPLSQQQCDTLVPMQMGTKLNNVTTSLEPEKNGYLYNPEITNGTHRWPFFELPTRKIATKYNRNSTSKQTPMPFCLTPKLVRLITLHN